MADVFLQTVDSEEGLAVMIQGLRAPVFRGVTQPDGDRYVCGRCKKRVLADCVSPGDL